VNSEEKGMRKVRTGTVVSSKMDKTAVVSIERSIRHKMYGKIMRRHKKLYVHDPDGLCETGDVVRVVETRPLSKMKRWRYVDTVKKAE
jgi:small subunit ribosomal protein S17